MDPAPVIVLPSGLVCELRRADLVDWMGCRGDLASMARHAVVFEDEPPELDDADAAVVVRWAIGELASEDIDLLALLSRTVRVIPSSYLGLSDGNAALTLDLLVANRIAELKAAAEGGEDAEPRGADSPTAAFGRMTDPQLEEIRRQR